MVELSFSLSELWAKNLKGGAEHPPGRIGLKCDYITPLSTRVTDRPWNIWTSSLILDRPLHKNDRPEAVYIGLIMILYGPNYCVYVDKFFISTYMALKLGIQALGSYLFGYGPNYCVYVDKFFISTYMALKLGIQALGSYLKLTCEYELHILSNTKVGASKDPGKNYIKVRPPLVRHL